MTYSIQSSAFDMQAKLIKKTNPLIIDLGANVGQTVLEYRKVFPTSTIYAFEPYLPAFVKLQQCTELMKNVICKCYAVADKHAPQTLYTHKYDKSNSILPLTDFGIEIYSSDFLNQTEIQTTSLDYFCMEENIQKVDILKMDVQGAEGLVLKGASNLLKEHRISIVYSEVMFISHYQGAPLFYEIASTLKEYGYEFFDMYNPVHTDRGRLRHADALFVCEGLIN